MATWGSSTWDPTKEDHTGVNVNQWDELRHGQQSLHLQGVISSLENQQPLLDEWPEPSACPERRENLWGPVPPKENWQSMYTQELRPAVLDDNTMTPKEIGKVLLAWLFTLLLWWSLFVTVPVCETIKSQDHICAWYWYRDEDGELRHGGWPWPVIGLGYPVLIITCLLESSVFRFLSNKCTLRDGLDAFVESMQKATPVLHWHLVAYHMVAHDTDENRWDPVTTHEAEYDYPYDAWWDVSEPMASAVGARVLRVRFEREWIAADLHTKKVHQSLYRDWIAKHDRDKKKTVSCRVTMPNVAKTWKGSRLIEKNPGDRPPFLGISWYVLCTFLTFGVLYQHYFYWVTAATSFKVVKVIKRHPRPDDPEVA